ncbi:MAG: hypothetical protein CL785_01605 [Chloroflexi bacterium]|nr:hypothetical protein [Chloroflexota bacterium]|tara:strand:+ start:594 stop:1862 length:1269 start_codon:yes stop_codon:yes gene_type:complete
MQKKSNKLNQSSFYYGWVIIGVIFISSTATGGIGSCVQSVFFEPMRLSLGLNSLTMSAVASFRTFTMAIIAPLAGPLADRNGGARFSMSLGSLIGGLSLIAMFKAENPWQMFMALGFFFGLAQAFLGGQVITPVIVAKWFVEKRGRAMAIAAMGISMGCLVMTPISQWLVDSYGWRQAWVILGIFMISTLTPLTALFIRRQPEDLGLLPDGKITTNYNESTPSAAMEISYQLREIIKIPAPWILAGVQMLVSLSATSVLLHQIPYLLSKGFQTEITALYVTVFAGFSMVGKPFYGYFAERISPKYLAISAFAGASTGLAILLGTSKLQGILIAGAIYGLNFGSFVVLMNILWADYFGRKYLGAIRGFFAPVGIIAGVVGPLVGGGLADKYGSYDQAFIFYAACWLVAIFLMLFSQSPRRNLS